MQSLLSSAPSTELCLIPEPFLTLSPPICSPDTAPFSRIEVPVNIIVCSFLLFDNLLVLAVLKGILKCRPYAMQSASALFAGNCAIITVAFFIHNWVTLACACLALYRALNMVLALQAKFDAYDAVHDIQVNQLNTEIRNVRRSRAMNNIYRRFSYYDPNVTTGFPQVDQTIAAALNHNLPDHAIDDFVAENHGDLYPLRRISPEAREDIQTQSGAPPTYEDRKASRERLNDSVLPKLLSLRSLSNADLTLLGVQRYSKAQLTAEIEFYNEGRSARVDPSRIHLHYREMLKRSREQYEFMQKASKVIHRPKKSATPASKQDAFDTPTRSFQTTVKAATLKNYAAKQRERSKFRAKTQRRFDRENRPTTSHLGPVPRQSNLKERLARYDALEFEPGSYLGEVAEIYSSQMKPTDFIRANGNYMTNREYKGGINLLEKLIAPKRKIETQGFDFAARMSEFTENVKSLFSSSPVTTFIDRVRALKQLGDSLPSPAEMARRFCSFIADVIASFNMAATHSWKSIVAFWTMKLPTYANSIHSAFKDTATVTNFALWLANLIKKRAPETQGDNEFLAVSVVKFLSHFLFGLGDVSVNIERAKRIQSAFSAINSMQTFFTRFPTLFKTVVDFVGYHLFGVTKFVDPELTKRVTASIAQMESVRDLVNPDGSIPRGAAETIVDVRTSTDELYTTLLTKDDLAAPWFNKFKIAYGRFSIIAEAAQASLNTKETIIAASGYILTGPPGTGKTSLINAISDRLYLLIHGKEPDGPTVYTKPNESDYNEGYKPLQHITYKIDELYNTKDSARNIQTSIMLQSYVSPTPVNLNMAFESKGKVQLNSLFIAGTANWSGIPFDNAGLSFPYSLARRFVMVDIIPDTSIGGYDPDTNRWASPIIDYNKVRFNVGTYSAKGKANGEHPALNIIHRVVTLEELVNLLLASYQHNKTTHDASLNARPTLETANSDATYGRVMASFRAPDLKKCATLFYGQKDKLRDLIKSTATLLTTDQNCELMKLPFFQHAHTVLNADVSPNIELDDDGVQKLLEAIATNAKPQFSSSVKLKLETQGNSSSLPKKDTTTIDYSIPDPNLQTSVRTGINAAVGKLLNRDTFEDARTIMCNAAFEAVKRARIAHPGASLPAYPWFDTSILDPELDNGWFIKMATSPDPQFVVPLGFLSTDPDAYTRFVARTFADAAEPQKDQAPKSFIALHWPKFAAVLVAIAAIVCGIAAWFFVGSASSDDPDTEPQYTSYNHEVKHLTVSNLRRPNTQLADSTLVDIVNVLHKNCVTMRVTYPTVPGAVPVTGKALIIKARQIVTNFHMIALSHCEVNGETIPLSDVHLEIRDYQSTNSIHVTLAECKIKHWKGDKFEADLVTIKLPRRAMSIHRNVTNYFVTEKELNDRLLGNAVALTPTTAGFLIEAVGAGTFECWTLPSLKHKSAEPTRATDSIGEFLTTDAIEFSHPSKKGDCMNIYAYDNPKLAHKLGGFHVAGVASVTSIMQIVTQEMIRMYTFDEDIDDKLDIGPVMSDKTEVQTARTANDPRRSAPVNRPVETILLDRDHFNYPSVKSDLIRTSIDPTRTPPKIPVDVASPEAISNSWIKVSAPYGTGRSKYTDLIEGLTLRDLLSSAQRELKRRRVAVQVTLAEALQGHPTWTHTEPIRPDTSGGFGATGFKKNDYVKRDSHQLIQPTPKLVDYYNAFLEQLDADLLPIEPYLLARKPELRLPEKNKFPRIVYGAGMLAQTAFRQHFGAANDMYTHLGRTMAHCIGIDLNSAAGQRLHNIFAKVPIEQLHQRDVSNNDNTMARSRMVHFFDKLVALSELMEEAYGDFDPKIRLRRRKLASWYTNFYVVHKDVIWRTEAIEPSGANFTTTSNSDNNRNETLEAFLMLVELHYPEELPSFLADDCKRLFALPMINFGDDQIFDGWRFSFEQFAQVVKATFGRVITPPAKGRDLSGITLLSRNPRLEDGYVFWALPHDTIINTSLWRYDDGEADNTALPKLVDSELREWFYHGKAVFDVHYSRLNSEMIRLNLPPSRLSYYGLLQEHIAKI